MFQTAPGQGLSRGVRCSSLDAGAELLEYVSRTGISCRLSMRDYPVVASP